MSVGQWSHVCGKDVIARLIPRLAARYSTYPLIITLKRFELCLVMPLYICTQFENAMAVSSMGVVGRVQHCSCHDI